LTTGEGRAAHFIVGRAFGVGAIVGGVVDVLAISGLNAVLSGQERRREWNFEAKSILDSYNRYVDPSTKADYAYDASQILERSEGNIDRQLCTQLEEVIAEAAAKEVEERRRLLERRQQGLGMP
jgi:hypothetical protein